MQYTINKAQKAAAASNKQRMIVIGGITLVITLLAVIIFMVYRNAARPDTYEELMPLMEEAAAFDAKVSEISKPYEAVEEQVGEDVYFRTIERDYQTAAEKQREVIEEIERVEAAVREMGGITNYEELQRVKQQPTDSFIAQEYESKYGASR